jgi:sugar phosphate isomerase/epimerase
MRIAAFPKAFLHELIVDRSMTIFEWIELARTLGVDGLELHPGFFHEGSQAEIDAVGEALAAAGFEMPMLCASPDFTHPDAGQRARERAHQADAIRLAAQLGGDAPTCRVLSGQAHPEVGIEQGLDWATESIEELLPLARELGVALCLENHYKASTWAYPEFAQRKPVFLELLSRIEEREWFGVQFDPSNALVAGEDSAQFLAEVVDRVFTMQASDRYLAEGASLDALRLADGTIGYSPDLRHGVIGQGLNDYPRIFETLRDAGYDGWISIEDGVNGMGEMAESAAFLRAARDEWFGGSRAVDVAARRRATKEA